MAVPVELTQVMTMLGLVTDAAVLMDVAADCGVDIAVIEPVRADVRQLYRLIVARLNSAEFDALEDGGTASVLASRDRLRVHLGDPAADRADRAKTVLLAALGPKQEALDVAAGGGVVDAPPEIQHQGDSSSEYSSAEEEVSDAGGRQLKHQKLHRRDVEAHELAPRKELKLTGVIGKPKSKKTLSLSSLKSQIRMAQGRHHKDSEIVAAVIKMMSPKLELRTYFEEQRNLTVEDMMFHLEAHYQKQDVKMLFNKLGSSMMGDGQSAIEFAYQLLGDRNRLMNLPKSERGAYSKKLIQEQFLRTLDTGMRNEVVRRKLDQLLGGDVDPTDKEIIDEINNTCMIDGEHQTKLAAFSSRRRQKLAAAAAADESSSDSEESSDGDLADQVVKKNKNKSSSSDVLSAQLTTVLTPILDPITAQVNALSTSFGQLVSNQTNGNQPPAPAVSQPAQMNAAAVAYPSHPFVPQLYYNQPSYNPAPFNQISSRGQGRGRGPGRGGYNQQPRFLCPKCTQDNAAFCNHCRVCYSVAHRMLDCPHRNDPNFVPTKNC